MASAANSISELRPKLLDILVWLDKIVVSTADAERLRDAIKVWSADCVRVRDQQKVLSAAREQFLNSDLIGDLQRGGGGLDATKGSEDWKPVLWHLGQDREDTFPRFVPPELHDSIAPTMPVILPLGDKHVSLSRIKKLVLLAAVYDASVTDNAPKFDPWRDGFDPKQHDYWFLVYQIQNQGLDDVELGYVLAAFKDVVAEFATESTNKDRGHGGKTADGASSADHYGEGALCLVVILEQLGWRVSNNRRRLNRLDRHIQEARKKSAATTALETKREELTDELARYEDLLNDCAEWIRVRTGIPQDKVVEVATSTAFTEGEERDRIYSELRKLDERGLTAELFGMLAKRDGDALASVGLMMPASESGPNVVRGENGGANNRVGQVPQPSKNRLPAFEQFEGLSRFTDIAQELLYGPDNCGLPLPRMDGFEGHPYFNESTFGKLLTEVRRYCPDFSSQDWLKNPDPTALLVEMEIAIERRRKAEASEHNGTATDATNSPIPPPPAEARFSWKVHGENFVIRFDGEVGSFRKSLVGFQRYRQLLQSRDRRVSMAELYGSGSDQRVTNDLDRAADWSVDENGLKIIDDERAKQVALQDEARKVGDLETVADCEEQIKKIDEFLDKHTRLKKQPDGTHRRVAKNISDPYASMRSTILDSFKEARQRLGDNGMPKLAGHLDDCASTNNTTGEVEYSQSGAVPWEFE